MGEDLLAKENFKELRRQYWDLIKSGRLPEAELKLREALEQDHFSPPLVVLIKADLADVLLRQRKSKEAEGLTLEVLEQSPQNVRALTVLGLAALKRGEYEEAVENLQQSCRLEPNPYRYGRLARAFELQGHLERALDLLKQALEEYPDDRFLLKQYTTLQKKSEGAAGNDGGGLLSRLADEEEDSLPYAEALRQRLEQLPPEKALEQLQKIMRVGKRKENPHLYVFQGDLLRLLEKELEAAKAYRRAFDLNPEELYALTQEAFCYRRAGEKEKAWPLLKLLLSRDPGQVTVKSALLKDAAELEKGQEALDFLEGLLQEHPHRKELYGLLNKLRKILPKEIRDENS